MIEYKKVHNCYTLRSVIINKLTFKVIKFKILKEVVGDKMKEKLVKDLRKLVCELCDDDDLEYCYICCIEEEIVKILNGNGIDISN